jgi:hypothetical protein
VKVNLHPPKSPFKGGIEDEAEMGDDYRRYESVCQILTSPWPPYKGGIKAGLTSQMDF